LTVFGVPTYVHVISWTIYSFFLALLFSLINIVIMIFIKNEIVDNVFIWFWFLFFFLVNFAMNSLGILISSIVSTG